LAVRKKLTLAEEVLQLASPPTKPRKAEVVGAAEVLFRQIVSEAVSGASGSLRLARRGSHRVKKDSLWSVLVMSDLHFGGKSWHAMTGADYDLTIASRLVRETASRLLGRSVDCGRRSIVLAGDTLHFDTIAGTTTGGTFIDRDSRLPKTLKDAVASVAAIIDASAEEVQTDVTLVPGNHDSALSWALQTIFEERYRNDKRVTVDGLLTTRKYLTHENNLLGVTHGDKGKKKLAGIMAYEARQHWQRCTYREWHVGHLHHQACEITTIDGVVVRTHPTIVPPDSWHTEMGFVGAERGMQGFLYHPQGGCHEMHMEYVR
jgi:hypothetical protein